MSQEECDRRHQHLNWLLGAILTILTVTFAGTAYQVQASISYASKVELVENELKTHQAVQAVKEANLLEALQDIKKELQDIKKEIKERSILKNP